MKTTSFSKVLRMHSVTIVCATLSLVVLTCSGRNALAIGANGSNPVAALISDGTNLYGSCQGGGANSLGTLYQLPKSGASGPAVKHSWAGSIARGNGGDEGSIPLGALVKDPVTANKYWGTCSSGGTLYSSFAGGMTWLADNFGGIYSVTTTGGVLNAPTFIDMPRTVVGGNNWDTATDGSNPCGALLAVDVVVGGVTHHRLYGTCKFGGANGSLSTGGTVFYYDITSATFGDIYDFTTGNAGGEPQGNLVNDGTYLYGTEPSYSLHTGCALSGNVFRLKPDGTSVTRQYQTFQTDDTCSSIQDCIGNSIAPDSPNRELFLDGSNIYGACAGDVGTAWELPIGNALAFASFAHTNPLIGCNPAGGLVKGNDGIIYGATSYETAGNSGAGRMFSVDLNQTCGTTDTLTHLHIFGANEPADCAASLIPDDDGTSAYLYGVSAGGGTNSIGTVFRYDITNDSVSTHNGWVQSF